MWWIVCVYYLIEVVDLCILWVFVFCFKVVDWWLSVLRWFYYEMSIMFYFEVRFIIYFILDNNIKIDIESFKNEGKFKISYKLFVICMFEWGKERRERERGFVFCGVLFLCLVWINEI